MFPAKGDTTIAFKTTALADFLSATDKAVAAAILDHFNRKTGQCDPSLDRISKLLGVHERTVIRSTKRLVKFGLFDKRRHGGKSHRNSYAPNWKKFRELENAWNRRRQSISRNGLSALPCQNSHLAPDQPVTQTYTTNQLSETYPSHQHRERAQQLSSPKLPKRLGNKGKIDHPARVAAERRWSTSLHTKFSKKPNVYAFVVDQIDEELRMHATEAELRKGGAGLKLILEQLELRDE